MSFPRYPKYKDSGAEWLGKVPIHWNALPIKQLGRLKGGAGFPHDEQGVEGEELPFFKVNALAQADREGLLLASEDSVSRATAVRLGAFVFPARTLILAKVGAALLLGRIRLLGREACIDNNMMGIIPSEISDISFLRYAMSLVRFDVLANPGAVPSLNATDLGGFRLPTPSLDEQARIAAFLDRETAKIDVLVAEQRRLIELLKEKRQVVISDAVTKGLNPHAPMKESAIEWLGEVPAHWEVKRLKYLGEAITGLTYAPEDVVGEGSGILVLRSSNVQQGKISLADNVYVSTEIPSELITRTGDILICSRNGSRSLVGKNAILDESSSGVTFGAFMTIFRSPFSSYLSCVFNSSLFTFQSSAFLTSTINQLTIGVLNGFEVAFPPEDERKEITDFIQREAGRLDTLARDAEKVIHLLQERRTALISAAVTGQIDVRQLAEKQVAA